MRLTLLATGTDSVAVGVTVVATLLVVALVVAVGYLLKAVREMRREAQGLAREAQELLDELGSTVRRAGRDEVRSAVSSAGEGSGLYSRMLRSGSNTLPGAKETSIVSRVLSVATTPRQANGVVISGKAAERTGAAP